jgi:hypothetical protein
VRIFTAVTELKKSTYSAYSGEPVLDHRQSPADKTRMARYLFGVFSRCLYGVQTFQSKPERKLAVILERDSLKWLRPALGQFQIYYKVGADQGASRRTGSSSGKAERWFPTTGARPSTWLAVAATGTPWDAR